MLNGARFEAELEFLNLWMARCHEHAVASHSRVVEDPLGFQASVDMVGNNG